MSIARLDEVRAAFREALAAAGSDPEALERVRVAYAGQRSGLLRDLAAALRELPPADKREYGRRLNELKSEIQEALAEAQRTAHEANVQAGTGRVKATGHEVDVTLPGRRPPVGAEHPVQLVRRRVESIFLRMAACVRARHHRTGHPAALGPRRNVAHQGHGHGDAHLN